MFSRASGGDASSCVPRRRAEGAPRHDPPPPPESDGSNGPLSPSLRAGGGHSGWQPRRVVHIPFTVTRDVPIWAAATAPWWCGGTLRPPLAKPSRCRVLPCALGTCAGPLGVCRSATTHTRPPQCHNQPHLPDHRPFEPPHCPESARDCVIGVNRPHRRLVRSTRDTQQRGWLVIGREHRAARACPRSLSERPATKK